LESYLTLAGELRHEGPKVKGSRFVATVAPVTDEEEAKALLARVRRELHDARHHGSAWRLGPAGDRFRSSDDGEPSGSTGKPILAAIEGRELTDVAVIVTRWFGGTKLGVGGLVRAYGGAAAEALDLAPVLRVELRRRFRLRFPYECTGPVQGMLSELGLEPEGGDWGEEVELRLAVPLGQCEVLLAAFTERTAGRGAIQELEP